MALRDLLGTVQELLFGERDPLRSRRKQNRVQCDFEVACFGSHGRLEARLMDLGPEGLRLRVPTPRLKRNQDVRVSALGESHTLLCRVVWTRAGESGQEAGLRYTDTPENLTRSWLQLMLRRVERQVRQERRVSAGIEVDVEDSEGQPLGRGQVVDLGLGGAQLRMEESLPEGTSLGLSIRGPDSVAVHLLARVVGKASEEEGTHRYHVSFFPGYQGERVRLRRLLTCLVEAGGSRDLPPKRSAPAPTLEAAPVTPLPTVFVPGLLSLGGSLEQFLASPVPEIDVEAVLGGLTSEPPKPPPAPPAARPQEPPPLVESRTEWAEYGARSAQGEGAVSAPLQLERLPLARVHPLDEVEAWIGWAAWLSPGVRTQTPGVGGEWLHPWLDGEPLQVVQRLLAALTLGGRQALRCLLTGSRVAVGLGQALGIKDPEALQWLRWSALLRDLGEMVLVMGRQGLAYRERVAMFLGALPDPLPGQELQGVRVPEELVLRSRAGLTSEELEEHPGLGRDLVARVPGLARLGPVLLAHHERWDGKGFPLGLQGQAIPLVARCLAVADAWSALQGRGMAAVEAASLLAQGSGSRFDPAVIRAFQAVNRPGPEPRSSPGSAATR